MDMTPNLAGVRGGRSQQLELENRARQHVAALGQMFADLIEQSKERRDLEIQAIEHARKRALFETAIERFNALRERKEQVRERMREVIVNLEAKSARDVLERTAETIGRAVLPAFRIDIARGRQAEDIAAIRRIAQEQLDTEKRQQELLQRLIDAGGQGAAP